MSGETSAVPPASPGWIRPEDVMRVRKLKARRNALQARMISSSAPPLQILTSSSASVASDQSGKRRNPFRCSPNKRVKPEESCDLEVTSDATLFQLLNPSAAPIRDANASYDFSNIISKEAGSQIDLEEDDIPKEVWTDKLIVDWSLKTRLRIKSLKPLPWKHNFKTLEEASGTTSVMPSSSSDQEDHMLDTYVQFYYQLFYITTSEEASGTTGFVRCLSSSSSDTEDRTLDTSANAQFYQCCLVWQYPSLPWLSLFPRDHLKITPQTGLFGTDPKLAESLHLEWSESLRSLHQLLRVRQCPYFYVCGPTFTCLFRAAGVAGVSQAHALITPTTRGFRDAIKEEDIEFEMPLLDDSSPRTKKKQTGEKTKGSDGEEEDEEEDEEDDDDEEEEEREEAASWLEKMGVETSQFPNLNPNRIKMNREKFRHIDGTKSSLVYVEGVETQGLINFLLNSKSCVPITGHLAGVPPTLLSPVAFQGAALNTLKAKGGTIRQDGIVQHSMEVVGPILPHTLHQLTSLLSPSVHSFSATLHPIMSTLPFSLHTHKDATNVPQAFAQEGLVDCGLDSTTRHLMCVPPSTRSHTGLPATYREVTHADGKYTWKDQIN